MRIEFLISQLMAVMRDEISITEADVDVERGGRSTEMGRWFMTPATCICKFSATARATWAYWSWVNQVC
jgi:hypothetical protein